MKGTYLGGAETVSEIPGGKFAELSIAEIEKRLVDGGSGPLVHPVAVQVGTATTNNKRFGLGKRRLFQKNKPMTTMMMIEDY